MKQQLAGVLIASVFGTVFVFVNAGDPMPAELVPAARIAAVAALAATAVLGLLAARSTAPAGASTAPKPNRPGTSRRPPMFGRGFLGVVLTEAVLIIGGLRAIRVFDAPVETNVAWIAIVVGLHFIVLARVWKDARILVPGAVLTLLGVAGFALAAVSLVPLIPLVSGVLSGVTLLVCGVVATAAMWAAARRS
ncbi:hypothetical protein FZ103_22535 [Streptomonospora sp. PA3]|nr:hypothetical protein [Streptomonospora sp. PA3]